MVSGWLSHLFYNSVEHFKITEVCVQVVQIWNEFFILNQKQSLWTLA